MDIQQSDIFQKGKDLEWENADPGIQRQIMGYDEKIMLVKVKFTKGAVGKMHQHPHIQTTFVNSGSFEVTIGDEKQTLYKGDGFYVPPNVMHGALCLQPGVLIDVFSPLREDFL